MPIASLSGLGNASLSTTRMKVLSAFRIIGKLSNVVIIHNNIVIRSFYFDIESDVHIFPEFQAELDGSEPEETDRSIVVMIEKAHNEMR
jgi:hypothetical protein